MREAVAAAAGLAGGVVVVVFQLIEVAAPVECGERGSARLLDCYMRVGVHVVVVLFWGGKRLSARTRTRTVVTVMTMMTMMTVVMDVPVSFTKTHLLGALGIGAFSCVLAKIARQVVLRAGCAIGQADVVTVVHLVGASHLMRRGRGHC